MIIVLGSITAKAESFATLHKLGLEHVRRSRTEPGCIFHSMQVDAEDPMKLVFVEKWKDGAALAAHFKVKGSIDFVTTAREIAAAAPTIEIFEASPARLG
jgi:quinol monooxygenase YgiN